MMKKFLVFLICCMMIMVQMSNVHAVEGNNLLVIRHAIADEFLNSQGNTQDDNQSNNWFYQVRVNGSDMSTLENLTETVAKGWTQEAVQINREGGMHPSATEEAVLTWVSTYPDGTAFSIEGFAQKFDSSNGEGTKVAIYKNQDILVDYKVISTTTDQVDMGADNMTLNYGDALHFAVNCNGNGNQAHWWDYTRWSPVVVVRRSGHAITTQGEHGTVIASVSEASAGQEVELVVNATEGYRFVEGSLMVLDSENNEIPVNGYNRFMMPNSPVNITANFESVPSISHVSSLEFDTEQGNLKDEDQTNNWIYQYKYNVSDALLPSTGFQPDNSKIYNLEAYWDNPHYTATSNHAIRVQDVNSGLWSTAMLTRAWMNQGYNIFIGSELMQPDYGYDAVKTWVSTYEEPKDVILQGAITLEQPTLDEMGVRVLIMKENDVLLDQEITNAMPLRYRVTGTVLPGEKIHFLVHQKSNLGEHDWQYSTKNRVNWNPSVDIYPSDAVANDMSQPSTAFSIPESETAGNMFTYSPVDNGKALNNPNMGIHFAYYDNFLQHYGDGTATSDTLDYFEGMNIVYLRVPWSFIEKEDDVFDWSKFDEIIDYWGDAGKCVGFRFTSYEVEEQAAPLWLRDEKHVTGSHKGGTFGGSWVPNSNDLTFFNEYKELILEVYRKYGEDKRVDFIELGGLGKWGEGHNANAWDSTWRKFAEMFKEIFQDSHIDYLWPDDGGHYNHAINNGFGLYDDSIGYGGQTGNINAANPIWKNNAVRVEMTHYYEAGARGFFMNTPEKLLQSIENIHGSYFLVHAYPDRFWEEQSEISRKINRRIGYRFNIESAQWLKETIPGNEATFSIQLRNAGVAPNYRGGHVTVSLKNEAGDVVATGTNNSFNTKDLVVLDSQRDKVTYTDDEVSLVNVPVTVPANLPEGTYHVYVSIGDVDGNPIYELPYEGNDGGKRYPIGSIEAVSSLTYIQHTIGIDTNIPHGTIQVQQNEAYEGENITITHSADATYRLVHYTVNGVPITGNHFSMPNENVLLSAVFEKDLTHNMVEEFATEQGDSQDNNTHNNWFYQYVPYTSTSHYMPSIAGIQDMVYENGRWVRGGSSYPTQSSNAIHPDNGYDAVRTWVNTYSQDDASQVQIAGTLAKSSSQGNGTKVTIMKNNTVVYGPQVISGTTAVTFDFTTDITTGDRIYLIVNQNSPLVDGAGSDNPSRWFDETLVDMTIRGIQ